MADTKPLILITGAAGFIGSAIAWRLNRDGNNRLLLVDELGTSSKWKNLVPLAYHDYLDKDELPAAIASGSLDGTEFQAVIHMGACSSTTETDAAYLARNNFGYSKMLAEWCLKRSIRFIYASSAATYGDGTSGYSDDHVGLPALRPLNPYGYSKHMFDLWNLRRGHFDRDGVVGLKFFNVFGPNEYHKGDMRSLAAKAFEQIRDTGRIRLFKSHRTDYRDGQQLRDFLYVKDAVDMALFFLDPTRPGGIYNVGTGEARSWMDLANALFHSLGRETQVDFIPMPEAIRDKYQYHTKAELSKIRSIGYGAPIRSLEDGIEDYIPYLKDGFKTLGWN